MREDITSNWYNVYLKKWQQYYELLQQIEMGQNPIIESVETLGEEHETFWTEQEIKLDARFRSQIHKIGQKIQDLYWMSEHLKILHELGQTFSKTFDQQQIYRKAFELVSRVMSTDAFLIAIYFEGDDQIEIAFGIENGVEFGSLTVPFGPEENTVSRVILSKETLHWKTKNDSQDSPHILVGEAEEQTSACIFVPMMLGDQIKGVISAQSYRDFAYRKEHEELLKVIGFQVASAVETAKLYEKLFQVSISDELTNLKNQRAFHQDLDRFIAEAKEKPDASFTLIMLDSDNLKIANDQFGHHVGDMLLQQIGKAMQQVLSKKEEAYRYAGDEFMILASELTEQDARQMVDRIHQFLQEHSFEYQGHIIPISLSVGIAFFPKNADSADALKRAADDAMYHSKKHGKNCVSVCQL